MTKDIDLRKKFKVGDLIAENYLRDGVKKLFVFKITKFPHKNFSPPQYDIVYAKLVKVKEKGKWITKKDFNHYRWDEKAFWDFNFGRGKAYKYRGA